MLAIAGIYVTSLKEASVNLLIGLVLDIVIVAVLKAFTRRRRPAYDVDDQVFSFSTPRSMEYFCHSLLQGGDS